jgi:hypothetical protein
MGIDRIGKSAPPTPAPREITGATRSGEAAPSFTVSKSAPTSQASQVGDVRAATSPIDRLRTGEVDLNGYLDLKVDEATAHLGALPVGELASLRQALRDRLANDPGLAELVRRAAGEAPPPARND